MESGNANNLGERAPSSAPEMTPEQGVVFGGGEVRQESVPDNTGVEQGGVENVVKNTETGVEQMPAKSPERAALERLGQMNAEAALNGPIIGTAQVTNEQYGTAITDTGTVEDDNPATAADGEQIEKVWAERIRKVVELTKGDPRREQIEMNKLKADYMKKRFNRELGDRN